LRFSGLELIEKATARLVHVIAIVHAITLAAEIWVPMPRPDGVKPTAPVSFREKFAEHSPLTASHPFGL